MPYLVMATQAHQRRGRLSRFNLVVPASRGGPSRLDVQGLANTPMLLIMSLLEEQVQDVLYGNQHHKGKDNGKTHELQPALYAWTQTLPPPQHLYS